MKAIHKDFFREISKSVSRYLSILFIVALGVAFFSGIRATSPDMKMTLDHYLDQTEYMDIRVLSTMGLTEEDVRAVAALEGVEAVEASYTYDAYVISGQEKHVLHFLSVPQMLNSYDLVEGRDISDAGECVVDRYMVDKFGFQIGDTLTVTAPADDELSDHLTRETFTIVGIVTSSSYFTVNRDATDIGNGSTDAFVYLEREAFATDYYSALHVVVRGAAQETAFSEKYDATVKQVTDRLEDIRAAREEARYEEIQGEALSEIGKAESELAEAEEEAESELAEAAEKIADGEKELSDGREELAEGKATYSSEVEKAEKELSSGEKELSEGRKELRSGEESLEAGREELKKGKKELKASEKKLKKGQKEYEKGLQEMTSGQAEMESAEAELAAAAAELQKNKEMLEANRKELDATRQELVTNKKTLQGQKTEAEKALKQLSEQESQLQTQLEEAKAAKEALEYQITAAETAESTEQAEGGMFAEALAALKEQLAQAEAGIAALEKGLAEVVAGKKAAEDGLEKLDAAIAQIDQALNDPNSELNLGAAALAAGEKELEKGQLEYESGAAELKKNQKKMEAAQKELAKAAGELESGQKKLDAGWAEYASGESLLEENEEKLRDARAELKSGESELADGRKTLEDKKAEAASEFSKAEKELAEGESELAEAQSEYESGSRKASEEIASAEAEIADAKAELEDLDRPEWYILDRGKTGGYVEYGQNADRIGTIGRIFPLIFFLVAALISLTTMTRMVEAERVEIGTLKALGYSERQIAAKYVWYALSASLIGSAIGLVFGQKFIPWLIISTYMILYPNLPVILTPLNLYFSLLSAGAAILCVTGAAYATCHSVLRETPAQLMRPAAPPAGKKILLERIRPLWRRLSFTGKVTLRNMFRYKKRFFMTIFGTGGCTALLVFGFGLTDSIGGVVERQYDHISRYDMTVTLKEDTSEADLAAVEEVLHASEAAEGYALLRQRLLEIDSGRVNYSAYLTVPTDPSGYDAYFQMADRETGEVFELGDERVIITEKLADLMELVPGEEITVQDGDLTATFTVGAVAENYLMSYIFMSPALYEKGFGQAPVINTIQIQAPEASEKELDELSEEILKEDAPSGTTTTEYTRSQFARVLNSLDIITLVVVVAAAMLAFVVLYNLNNINMTERRRELATIKVLGFYDGETAAYIFRENILLTVVGSALGLILGKFLHYFIITTVETDVIMFIRAAQPHSYAYSFGLTCLFSLLVNGIMYFSVKKIDMIESLKSVE